MVYTYTYIYIEQSIFSKACKYTSNNSCLQILELNYPYEEPTTFNVFDLQRGGRLSITTGPRLQDRAQLLKRSVAIVQGHCMLQ